MSFTINILNITNLEILVFKWSMDILLYDFKQIF